MVSHAAAIYLKTMCENNDLVGLPGAALRYKGALQVMQTNPCTFVAISYRPTSAGRDWVAILSSEDDIIFLTVTVDLDDQFLARFPNT